jgi:hypothetical protein
MQPYTFLAYVYSRLCAFKQAKQAVSFQAASFQAARV